MQTMTIELPDELAEAVHAEAQARGVAPSTVVAEKLKTAPRMDAAYWRAFEGFMATRSLLVIDAEKRLTREEANARR